MGASDMGLTKQEFRAALKNWQDVSAEIMLLNVFQGCHPRTVLNAILAWYQTPDCPQYVVDALAEPYKSQLKRCEDHAGTMARDFDLSLEVMRDEIARLKSK